MTDAIGRGIIGERPQSRLMSVDALRGLVMVIMALDHARDFLSNATFEPTDMAHTDPALFFTRWITHFCAPVFVMLAGTGAFLSLSGGKSPSQLANFLWTRGLWLIVLEILVVTPLGWSFNASFGFVRLQVIWAIGASMVILAAFVPWAPPRWIGAAGLLMILGHDVFDGVHAPLWGLLHTITPIRLAPHVMFISLYPLIPWVGVMALGYGSGDLINLPPGRRERVLAGLGLAMIALFVGLRATNLYGDLSPWTPQADSVRTYLSFLNVSKYPPSLLYLLITLGPALVVLAVLPQAPAWFTRPLSTLGRVPLFYYLLHLPLLHGLAVLLSQLRYGNAQWLFHDRMAQHGAAHPLPPGYGYDLWVVYAAWIGAVVALYPFCRWYAGFKSRHKSRWLSYL